MPHKPTTKQMTKMVSDSGWEHVDFLDSHPIQPFRTLTGPWICIVCRQRIRPVLGRTADHKR